MGRAMLDLCSGVSSIQDPGQSSFSAKKSFTWVWASGLGMLIINHGLDAAQESRMSYIQCRLTMVDAKQNQKVKTCH